MSKAAKKKEEERIEKIIRNLLKLPENRRCINCTSLGPQYVCTTFWTFVCTNCSGLHREFTHRVKSVSMAKFSAEEVGDLQAGGNERAREIYFKVWDPQRHAFPDGSNQNRLRDFIRQVYVDRKYTGENTSKVAVTKKVDAMEDSSGRQSVDNPTFGGRTESGSKYHIDDRRSPQFKQDTGKSRNRPTRFEIVDDRFRDDDFCRWRRSDTQKVYNAESRSPGAPKTREKTSLPAVQSVKDILSEDIQPLREEKCPEDNNDAKNNMNTDPQEKPASSSAKGAVDAKPPEIAREKSFSLIDLMADPEPSDLAPQTQERSLSIVSANEGLIKSLRKPSNAPRVNSQELMLFELSDPPSGQVPDDVDIPNSASVVGEVHEASPGGTESILPCGSSDHMVARNDGSHLTSSGDISSTTQQLIPSAGTSSDQAWSSSPASNPHSSSSASVIEPFQSGPNVAQDITSQIGPRVSSMEAKSGGSGELPVDLFTGSYPSFQAPVQNWQFCPPHGMGFNMYQYYPPNFMHGPSFPNLARSRNPFDLSETVAQAQTPVAPSDQAMPPSEIPTHEISSVPGAFSGQQLPYGMPLSRSQGDNGVGTGQQKDPFAALSPIQQHTEGGQTVPSTANSLPSAGGNPFG